MYSRGSYPGPLPIGIILLVIGVISLTDLGTEALGGIIGGLVVAFVLFSIPWMKNQWGLFELRFLDSHENPQPKKEKRSTVISLPTGYSTIRFSLKPRTAISSINRFQFTAFHNKSYPQRLWPGITGPFMSTAEIMVQSLKKRNDDGSWTPYENQTRDKLASIFDGDFYFSEGSRQVFEITYKVSDSLKRWDGIIGVQIQYQQSGNNKIRNVNSKAFIQRRGHPPLTFLGRQIQAAEAFKQ